MFWGNYIEVLCSICVLNRGKGRDEQIIMMLC